MLAKKERPVRAALCHADSRPPGISAKADDPSCLFLYCPYCPSSAAAAVPLAVVWQPLLAAAVVLLVVVSQPLFVAAVVVAAEHLGVFERRLSVVPVFAAVGRVAVQHSGALAVVAVDATGLPAVVAFVAFAARCSAARQAGDQWRPGDYPLDDWHSDCSHSDYLASRSADDLGSADSDSPHLARSDWRSADCRLVHSDSHSADLGSAGSDSPHSACSDWRSADWHLADSQPADLHQVDLDSLRSADCRLAHSDSHSADLEQAGSDSPHSACSDWHWADWHLVDSQPAG